MHYIRLLRPPKLEKSASGQATLSLVITITTDLGDDFLSFGQSVEIAAYAHQAGQSSKALRSSQPLKSPRSPEAAGIWRDGLRVAKLNLAWPKTPVKGRVTLEIKALTGEDGQSLSVGQAADVLTPADGQPQTGRIVPVYLDFVDGVPSERCLRHVDIGIPLGTAVVKIEEDLGESIARHIWDSGIVTSSFLGMKAQLRRGEEASAIDGLVKFNNAGTSVLELGSGIGTLGIAVATILSVARIQVPNETEPGQTLVLLTDVPEAEERATSNIMRFQERWSTEHAQTPVLEYENLDWDDGKEGNFGPITSSRYWDWIILCDCTYNVDTMPALVQTLSALHCSNRKHAATLSNRDNTCSRVLLATKQRHESEEAIFELLRDHGWEYELAETLPLPHLGREDQEVLIYLLRKGHISAKSSLKRRVDGDRDDQPKKAATGSG